MRLIIIVAFVIFTLVSVSAEITDTNQISRKGESMLDQKTLESLSNKLAGQKSITFDELARALPPDKKREFINHAAQNGIFIFIPEFFDAVNDPDLKIRFLEALSEPISKPMLDKISQVSLTETNSRLKLYYGALLYRYNYDSGLKILESILSDGNSHIKKEAALILALNWEDSSAALVVKALDKENDLYTVEADALSVALGKWHNSIVQDFLKERFRQHPTDIFLALSVAFGNQKEFLPQIQYLWRIHNDEKGMVKTFLAAALSRLSTNRDDNPGINFLIERLPDVMPPPPSERGYSVPQEPFNIVTALGYCGSSRAETILRGLVETNWNTKLKMDDARRGLMGIAAEALSENLTTKNKNALAYYLKSAKPEDFSDEARSHFAFNILTADAHSELKSSMTNLVSSNLIEDSKTSNLKFLPYGILASSPRE
jgi:hypothetical protein